MTASSLLLRLRCRLFLLAAVVSLSAPAQTSSEPLRLALISDSHIADVDRHPWLLRTMDAQTHSTRLFNENVMAFRSAVEDAHRRGVRLVVMPGDLTDDGQLVNQHAMARLLRHYTDSLGMRFFVTTGNHDPLRPFTTGYHRSDYLGADGRPVRIGSDSLQAGPGGRVEPSLRVTGYDEQMAIYGDYGFLPRADHLFWTTPFAPYDYTTYSLAAATEASQLSRRTYQMCDTITMPDASYLVEPVEGLWLLAIDGNVYVPKTSRQGEIEFYGAGTGYDHILQYKSFLLPWIERVCREAQQRGKTLLTFCHYPLAEFNCGASPLIAEAWGKDKFDLYRVPSETTTHAFMNAGLRLHIGGHMHVNNTATVSHDGHRLVNIQVPSTAACIPAYKIMTLRSAEQMDVETIVIDSVSNLQQFFPLYDREWHTAAADGTPAQWRHSDIEATTFADFCHRYFDDLARLRFVPSDMPAEVRDSLVDMSGRDIMHLFSPRKARHVSTSWTGLDLITDLYRLRYSNTIGERQIPARRLTDYRRLIAAAARSTNPSPLAARTKDICRILSCFLHPEPCENFSIDRGILNDSSHQ